MKTAIGMLCLAGALLTTCPAHATFATITVSLGLSSEDFGEIGLGTINNYAYWQLTQGACSVSVGNTSCLLSGLYTGTFNGYMGGSYSLVTTYPGSGPSQLIGYSRPFPVPIANYFQYTYLPPGTTMTLDLTDNSGASYVAALYPVGPPGLPFQPQVFLIYTGTTTCTGLAPGATCNPNNVGQIRGATISGPVSGNASFQGQLNPPPPPPPPPPPVVPEPGGLAFLGLVPGAIYACRRGFAGMRSSRN
jgi:hypothetical protein